MGCIKTKDYIRLDKASDYIYGLTSVRRDPSTIKRWCLYGLKSQHGTKVKLRSSKRLNVRFTTIAWIDEFLRAIG